MEKFQALLNDDAIAKFEELLRNQSVCELAKRYLKELLEFLPEGKAFWDEQGRISGVKITRFRLRRKC